MLWHDFLDVREIGACKIDIECADIFLQIFAALRPGNWNNIFALSEYPGERELRRRAFFFARDVPDAGDEIEVALEIFALKPRRGASVIIFRQVFRFFDLTGQKSAAKRAVRHKPDAERAAGTENFLFGIARPKRVFRLQRGNG